MVKAPAVLKEIRELAAQFTGDNAARLLQTLTDTAGQTRSVGLISHVAMVKEAIPGGFQIDKTPRGSHVIPRGMT